MATPEETEVLEMDEDSDGLNLWNHLFSTCQIQFRSKPTASRCLYSGRRQLCRKAGVPIQSKNGKDSFVKKSAAYPSRGEELSMQSI